MSYINLNSYPRLSIFKITHTENLSDLHTVRKYIFNCVKEQPRVFAVVSCHAMAHVSRDVTDLTREVKKNVTYFLHFSKRLEDGEQISRKTFEYETRGEERQ